MNCLMYQLLAIQFISILLNAIKSVTAFSIPSKSYKNTNIVSKGWNNNHNNHPFVIVSSEGTNQQLIQYQQERRRYPTSLSFFGNVFEESGPLGKGITVGKIQISLQTPDRSSKSIFGILEDEAKFSGTTNEELAEMARDVCIALLRNSDDWRGACSDSKQFGGDDTGKAESLFNDWCTREAAKFDKEYIPKSGDEETDDSTYVVVSLIIEIKGDQTKFDGAGYSISGTKDVLSNIASNAMVDEGYCVNAVEVYWTPSARNEVLVRNDVIIDFPELIDI